MGVSGLKEILLSESCTLYGGRLYFVARDINIIFSMDKNTGDIRVEGAIPDDGFHAYRTASKIIAWKSKLVFVPLNSSKIWIYDVNDRTWNGIPLKENEPKYMQYKMFQAATYEDKIYLIGSHYPSIVCLDMQDETLTYFDEIFSDLLMLKDKVQDCFIRSSYARVGNLIYFASCLNNQVLKFNMETDEYAWITVGDDRNRYSGMTWDGANFWLAPRYHTPIIKWDGKDEIREFPLPKECDSDKMNFGGAVYHNGKIFLPGFMDNKTIVIRDDKLQIEEGQYVFMDVIADGSLVCQDTNGQITIINEKGEKRVFWAAVGCEGLRDFLKNTYGSLLDVMREESYKEDQLIDVNDLIDAIRHADENQNKEQASVIGNRIWHALNRDEGK